MQCRVLIAVSLCLLGTLANASKNESTCVAPDKWECSYGCIENGSDNCSASIMTEDVCQDEVGSFEWKMGCNCTCVELVCDYGCWDQEDEGCISGLNQMQCAEIYGHVEWSQVCNCRYGGEAVGNNVAGAANIYFSIPAFVVLFRESLEVVIVLVIIIQFLHKARDDGMISPEQFRTFRREVYVGAGAGFAVCIGIGVGFLALAAMFRGLFKGDNLLVFDGVMMTITCLVLSFLALNFYKMLYAKEGHERKMKATVERTMQTTTDTKDGAGFSKKHSFLILAFTTGMREGLESIIFLVGVISDLDDLSSLPLPIITALILARLCGCLFFQGTKKMHVEWFLRFSAFVLMLIAAGFFSSSIHKWQELEAFGTWSPKEDRPWVNHRVFDARECCNDKTNRFFVLMRALLGWQDQPTPLEFIAYALYWVVAIIVGFFLVRRAKRDMQQRFGDQAGKENGAGEAGNETADAGAQG